MSFSNKCPLKRSETPSTSWTSEEESPISNKHCTHSDDDDDTAERAYWESLMKRAILHANEESCELSSTQDETDLSSFLLYSDKVEHVSKEIKLLRMQSRKKVDVHATENLHTTHIDKNLKAVESRDSTSIKQSTIKEDPVVLQVLHFDNGSITIDESLPTVQKTTLIDCGGQFNVGESMADSSQLKTSFANPQFVGLSTNSAPASSIPSTICIPHNRSEIITGPSPLMLIPDATEPLFFENLSNELHDPSLCNAACKLFDLFEKHVDRPDDATIVKNMIKCIETFPEICQIRYPDIFSDDAVCFPMSYFSVSGCLPALKASYDAFPEAIACPISATGIPLHYACQHGVAAEIADFLLDKYSEGARRINYYGQTPLHMACATANMNVTALKTLLRYDSSAACVADANGDSPLHIVCRNPSVAAIAVPLLLRANPMAAKAVTNKTQKPLHEAASHGCRAPIVQALLKHGQAHCLDDTFQTPLHKIVEFYCRSPVKDYTWIGPVVRLLVMAYPEALKCADHLNDTPVDIAMCKLSPPRLRTILPLLKPR